MKTKPLVAALAAALMSMSASAHDPKEHEKEAAQSADCSKLKGMDMSKMDMNDPVMKALHKKCEAQLHHEHDKESKQDDTSHEEHVRDHKQSANGKMNSSATPQKASGR
jgi:hypothetical protein